MKRRSSCTIEEDYSILLGKVCRKIKIGKSEYTRRAILDKLEKDGFI